MMMSYISHLYCPTCGTNYTFQSIHQVCECGAPLLVSYDIHTLKGEMDRVDLIRRRENSLWRYRELLPVLKEENIVTLNEGMTPLIETKSYGESIGLNSLYMKDEGLMPTGTFKARGASVGISKAKELGVASFAMPTNGNAGAAWSLYAARANIDATIVMPKDAPIVPQEECVQAGANVYLVDGLINDASKIVQATVEEYCMYDASTLREPYRIEGKKTLGFEIVEQFNWEVPDVIVYPTGSGVGLIGIYKAIKELQLLGWIDQRKFPRLVAVQAEGCAPIVEAWEKDQDRSTFWENSKTHAFGINVPKPLGDFLILTALNESKGCAITVSDDELLKAQTNVAQQEGVYICPEGAAAFAATRKLARTKWIHPEESVIVLNTGAGIKYRKDSSNLPILSRHDRI